MTPALTALKNLTSENLTKKQAAVSTSQSPTRWLLRFHGRPLSRLVGKRLPVPEHP